MTVVATAPADSGETTSAPGGDPTEQAAARPDQQVPVAGPAASAWTALGPADAPAIVFIHGTRLTRAQWWPQLRRLSDRYRCIAVDLPGHGAQAGVPFTLDGAVATIVAAIDAEANGRRALLVGLSLGGYMAIETAEMRPELVAGLVLAGCSAEPVGPAALPFRGFAWLMEHVTPRALLVLNLAFFRTRYRRAISEPIVAGGFWSDAGATAVRGLIGRRYLERLGRLWTPVVVVNGALDPIFGPGGEPWASTCRRGRHVVIPWALHLSNLDRPTPFASAVDAAAREAFGEG